MSKKDEPLWCQIYRKQVIRPAQKERQTEQRGRTEASRSGFYNTTAWKVLRHRRIVENPLCQHCETKGRLNAGKVVDHIKPVELFPELALSFDNTQSLCDFCHGLKTRADAIAKRKAERLKQGVKIMNELEKNNIDPGGVVHKNKPNGKPQDREVRLFFPQEKPRGGHEIAPFFVIGG